MDPERSEVLTAVLVRRILNVLKEVISAIGLDQLRANILATEALTQALEKKAQEIDVRKTARRSLSRRDGDHERTVAVQARDGNADPDVPRNSSPRKVTRGS